MKKFAFLLSMCGLCFMASPVSAAENNQMMGGAAQSSMSTAKDSGFAWMIGLGALLMIVGVATTIAVTGNGNSKSA